ncbi:MAG: phosphoglycerate dehydrogenase, partial [Candidatus Binatia bacterium]
MAHKLLISDPFSEQGLERLRAYEDIEVDLRPKLPSEELARILPAYHGLIIRSGTKVTQPVIAAATNLRVIGRAGIGVDNIDVEAATKQGIVVMNTPGGNNVTTAEHTLTLLLALARNIPQATASLRAGRWEREKFTGSEVCNKVLGVVGLGNIGAIVADRALGLKMRVLAFDPFVSPETAAKLGVEIASLDEIYANADFITVHTPLTKETRGLIDAAAFTKMKKGVRIVNCARGGIVDETALLDALNSGKVAGAALDVFIDEPPPADHPLIHHDRVICTPHLGAATDEAQINVAIAIADQVANFLTIGVIQNAVNFPALTAKQLSILQPYLTLGDNLGSFVALS